MLSSYHIIVSLLVVQFQLSPGARVNSVVKLKRGLREVTEVVRATNMEDPPAPDTPFNDFIPRLTESTDMIVSLGSQFLVVFQEALVPLQETPADVSKCMSTLQTNLWGVIEIMVDEGEEDAASTKELKKSWNTAWDDTLKEAIPSITDALGKFTENATAGALTEIVVLALDSVLVVGDAVLKPFNITVLGGLSVLMQGIADSWEAFDNGNTSAALETAWTAVNASIYLIMPESATKSEAFNDVMVAIEGQYQFLLKFSVQWYKSLVSAKMCYRGEQARDSRPPQCVDDDTMPGFTMVGSQCIPNPSVGADCMPSCAEAGECRTGFCPSDRSWCCKKPSDEFRNTDEWKKLSLHVQNGCQFAQYFESGLTLGDATDYYQCVAPATLALVQESETLQQTEDPAEHAKSAVRSLAERSMHKGESNVQSLDGSMSGKWPWDIFGPAPAPPPAWGSYVAKCYPWSNFPDTDVNGECLSACEDGYIPKEAVENKAAMCIKSCNDDMPKVGKLGVEPVFFFEVCGTSDAAIVQGNSDLLLIAKNSALAVQAAFVAIFDKNDATNADWKSVQDEMVNLGTSFALPQCP